MTAALALTAVNSQSIIAKSETANIVSSDALTVDYTMAYDVNYKVSLPDLYTNINWDSAATMQNFRGFLGLELSSYVNFTIKAEIMQKTIQQLTLSLVPVRVYPVLTDFSATRSVTTGAEAIGDQLSAYISLGEIHTIYYSIWKSCGNTFVNQDGSSNFDDVFQFGYCGYNSDFAKNQ
jgi:hypothetical protein